MTTIREILYKWVIRNNSAYIAEVLYVDNPINSVIYFEKGVLFEGLPILGGTLEQVSEQEAHELVELLRGRYNVLITRNRLHTPPDDVIVPRNKLFDRL